MSEIIGKSSSKNMTKVKLAKCQKKKRLKELKDKGVSKLSKNEISELLTTLLEYLKI